MERTDEPEPLKVTFGGPAKDFTDAAPIGNGRLGAMVWGGVASELLQLNGDVEKIDPPLMEGLDALVAKSKTSTVIVDPETTGNGQPLPPPSSQWFAWKSGKKALAHTSIVDGLKRLYIEKLEPLEVAYRFNDFVSPLLARREYPGAHIGPEPTTDRFVVVMLNLLYTQSGSDERTIPGNIIVVHPNFALQWPDEIWSNFFVKI